VQDFLAGNVDIGAADYLNQQVIASQTDQVSTWDYPDLNPRAPLRRGLADRHVCHAISNHWLGGMQLDSYQLYDEHHSRNRRPIGTRTNVGNPQRLQSTELDALIDQLEQMSSTIRPTGQPSTSEWARCHTCRPARRSTHSCSTSRT
jgi:hypothetical protein